MTSAFYSGAQHCVGTESEEKGRETDLKAVTVASIEWKRLGTLFIIEINKKIVMFTATSVIPLHSLLTQLSSITGTALFFCLFAAQPSVFIGYLWHLTNQIIPSDCVVRHQVRPSIMWCKISILKWFYGFQNDVIALPESVIRSVSTATVCSS